MNPKFPVFIPSKGRHETQRTMRMFDDLRVPYTVFVEPQEAELYARRIRPEYIHALPHRDQGLTVTRNYIWDYAAEREYEWFWTFDDNITGLYRFNRNLKCPCADGTPLAIVEDFTQRYENVAISGMNYFMFVVRKSIVPPYYLNTRVYSNMLIKTFAKDRSGSVFRNRLFYNDDTDLCLQVLKSGLCTVLFNAFLVFKLTTMTVKGGMTDYYEKTDKRFQFAKELQAAHPESVQIIERWGRWHHLVNYAQFKQPLRRKPGLDIPDQVNNFGLIFQEKLNGRWVNVDQELTLALT